MDIQILLLYQSFRENLGDFFTEFFSKATYFAELSVALAVVAILYWCVDKKTASYLMLGLAWNRLINGFLKITFCVYRPWIRDPRILPDSEAIVTATGYSFPSGHSTIAASVYGGLAVKKGTPVRLKVVMLIITFLVMFSRNYLTVHTPQDVIVGAGLSLIVMKITEKILEKCEQSQNADLIVVLVTAVLSIALVVYACNKSYPVDYDKNGEILVDGLAMAKDSFKNAGTAFGFAIGWFLEKRYVNFSTEGSTWDKIYRAAIGLIGYFVITMILASVTKLILSEMAAAFINAFLAMFYVVLLFPLIIKADQKRKVNE